MSEMQISSVRGMDVNMDLEMGRIGWDDYFMAIAWAVSRRADCTRRMVGALLVESTSNRIIGSGYNGAPSKSAESCLDGGCPRGLRSNDEIAPGSAYDGSVEGGRCIAVHAEANALLHSFRGIPSVAGTMYVTTEPCPDCWKLMAAGGVIRVVWSEWIGMRFQRVERMWTDGAWKVRE